jgi:hypothetical protein
MIDVFVICNWVDTRWQQYSTHLHTNSIQNNRINLGRVRAVPRLGKLYPGFCLTTEEKARKNPSQGSQFDSRCFKKGILIKMKLSFTFSFLLGWQVTTSENTAKGDVGMAQWLINT